LWIIPEAARPTRVAVERLTEGEEEEEKDHGAI
jgi:hypothetical protein